MDALALPWPLGHLWCQTQRRLHAGPAARPRLCPILARLQPWPRWPETTARGARSLHGQPWAGPAQARLGLAPTPDLARPCHTGPGFVPARPGRICKKIKKNKRETGAPPGTFSRLSGICEK